MKLIVSLAALLASVAVAQQVTPDVTSMDYVGHDDTELIGFVAKPEGVSAENPAPAVIIIPDWDGNNFYEQQRVTMLAKEFGYIGFAADIYGKEFQVVEGDMRGTLARTYRSDAELFTQRMNSAIEIVKAMPEVDAENVAMIGYCFGGTGVLTYVLRGLNDVSGKSLIQPSSGALLYSDVLESCRFCSWRVELARTHQRY